MKWMCHQNQFKNKKYFSREWNLIFKSMRERERKKKKKKNFFVKLYIYNIIMNNYLKRNLLTLMLVNIN